MEEGEPEGIEVIVLFGLSHTVIFAGGGTVELKSFPVSQ